MKKLLVIMLSCCSMTACSSSMYQQIATLKSNQVEMNTEGQFVAKYSDVSIIYDFWAPSGTVAFVIQNNSDKDLYLHMAESYFINNGYAYDYYQGRVYGSSSQLSVGASSTNVNSYSNTNKFGFGSSFSGILHGSAESRTNIATQVAGTSYGVGVETSVEYAEPKIVCVPAHSYKAFEQFNIQTNIYRDCGFITNPNSQTEKSELNFTADNSPFVIENRLMLEIEGNKTSINHKFYVSELQNISEDILFEYSYSKRCDGYNGTTQLKFHKMLAPNRYYIRYFPDYYGDRTKDQY